MRIISWNVCGDSFGKKKTIQKVDYLDSIIRYWEIKDHCKPHIICLQEVSSSGAFKCELEELGYHVVSVSEGYRGGGRNMLIAVLKCEEIQISSILMFECQDNYKFYASSEIEKTPLPAWEFSEASSSPKRVPFGMEIAYKNVAFCVFTYHASLGGNLLESLMAFSVMTQQTCYGIIAGDLNWTAVDGKLQYYDGTNVHELFPQYRGFSHGLDHIIAKGLPISDGIDGDIMYSDHAPISANIII